MEFTLKANLIDIISRETFPAEIVISNKKIASIQRINETLETYILPGFIDAHVHIESSMLVPSEFAKIAINTIGSK